MIDWITVYININLQLKLDLINVNCYLYLFFLSLSPFCYCGSHFDIRFPISNILETYQFIHLLYLAGFLNFLFSKLSIMCSISWVNVFCCWFRLPLKFFLVCWLVVLVFIDLIYYVFACVGRQVTKMFKRISPCNVNFVLCGLAWVSITAALYVKYYLM